VQLAVTGIFATARTAFPTLARIFEIADQFAFLGINAEDGASVRIGRENTGIFFYR
jgi:hypothetical protein